jgi:hypothetical protein
MLLAYTQPTAAIKHPLSVAELQQIGAMAGQDFLRFLDQKLKTDSLKTCVKVKEEGQALFLLLFGTILAVGYTNPVVGNPNAHSGEVSSSISACNTLTEAYIRA